SAPYLADVMNLRVGICADLAEVPGVAVVIRRDTDAAWLSDDPCADHGGAVRGTRDIVAPSLAHALALDRVQRACVHRATDQASGDAVRVLVEDHTRVERCMPACARHQPHLHDRTLAVGRREHAGSSVHRTGVRSGVDGVAGDPAAAKIVALEVPVLLAE